MKIVIRTDSSSLIGSGHLMRCLTLADMLAEKGADVEFICRDLPNNMSELVTRHKFKLHLLPYSEKTISSSDNQYADWLGVDWEDDAEQTANCFNSIPVDWLIVDHYALDSKWEKQFRPIVGQIMVIDDLANRKHDCDMLLDQNLYHNAEIRYVGLIPKECVQLTGLDNTLLRREFYDARENNKTRDGIIRRLLVFLGGADVSNETSKAIKAIANLNRPELAVDVVIGGANVYSAEIRRLVAELPHVRIHGQIDNMAKLMASADIAIGGGGSTTWERCFLGLPTLTMVLAENQREMIAATGKRGALWNLGWYSDVTSEDIQGSLERILNSPDEVREVSRKSVEIMGGNRSYANHPIVTEMLKGVYC